MAFHQLLWSVHSRVMKKLLEENPSLNVYDIAPHSLYPQSTNVFIKNFERIIEQYRSLQELIDLSSGRCKRIFFPGKHNNGLYLESFCNGISAILEEVNNIFCDIEESFLSESSSSLCQLIGNFEHVQDVLTSLNLALQRVKSGKYFGCPILDLCETLAVMSGSAVPENTFRKLQQFCFKQFFKQTKLWLLEAELFDPHDEFFIVPLVEINGSLEYSASEVSILGTSLRSNPGSPKFKVNPHNLPNMVPLSVAMKMVFIGEALKICQYNEVKSKNSDKALSMFGIAEKTIVSRLAEVEKKERFNIADFSSLIDDLWIGINKYIRLMSDDIGNVSHQITLMWEVYLLGRGELFQEFLLRSSSILNSDVTLVESRNLNKAFKDAVYYVYLTEKSEFTDQFYFKLPDKKALHQGSSAWSHMQLKCRVKWPLHYLFTHDVIQTYNQLVSFLLRLKKAQLDCTPWKNIMALKNLSLRMELLNVRLNLMSVVGNLQNYCFTNVISNEMTILLNSVKSTAMFTDLQKALSLFLTNVCNRLFLPNDDISNKSDVSPTKTVYKCFRTIFHLCGLFSELDGKDEDTIEEKLPAIKSKLIIVFRILFTLLRNIEKTYFSDNGSSSSHLYNLIMCLDYNGFFQKRYNTDYIR